MRPVLPLAQPKRKREREELTKDDLAAIEHTNELIARRLVLIDLVELLAREIEEPDRLSFFLTVLAVGLTTFDGTRRRRGRRLEQIWRLDGFRERREL